MEITKEEFLRLKKAQFILNRLEAGGVDNWEWYGDALNPEGEDSIDVAEEKLEKEIMGVRR